MDGTSITEKRVWARLMRILRCYFIFSNTDTLKEGMIVTILDFVLLGITFKLFKLLLFGYGSLTRV